MSLCRLMQVACQLLQQLNLIGFRHQEPINTQCCDEGSSSKSLLGIADHHCNIFSLLPHTLPHMMLFTECVMSKLTFNSQGEQDKHMQVSQLASFAARGVYNTTKGNAKGLCPEVPPSLCQNKLNLTTEACTSTCPGGTVHHEGGRGGVQHPPQPTARALVGMGLDRPPHNNL